MINKFQQGGQAASQEEQALMLFVQGLAQALQADPQQIVLVAQSNPEALKAAILTYQQTLDIQQAAQVFSQAAQKQTQAARHGAKLNYIKSLKHQCVEDEELYYYKKGGSIGCGCKKKEQHGGPITKDNPSWRDEFNRRKKLQKTNQQNTNQNGNTLDRIYDPKTGKYRQVTEEDRKKWRNNLNDAKKGKGEGSPQHKCGGTVEKFKTRKHQLGGNLNGVPFMLQGKDLPTAPKAEDRYKNGRRVQSPYYKEVYTPTNRMTLTHGASIRQYVKPITPYYNDTTYIEIPEHTSFIELSPRAASTNSIEDLNSPILDNNGWPTGHYKFKFNNSPEYEILKRRFNTAWNLAK